MGVLVYAESENNIVKKSALEAVSYAKALAEKIGSSLNCVVINCSEPNILKKYGTDKIFNITNGDFFRWRHVWPKIAEFFDMKVGRAVPQDLNATMADVGPLWQEMSMKYGLVVGRLDEMVSWQFANYVFGTTWDVMSDSTKIRRHGFHELLESEDMFLSRLNELRQFKVIPG